MNWPRIFLDGLSMSLLFNAVVGLGFMLVPQAYSLMFPKEIKEAGDPGALPRMDVSGMPDRRIDRCRDRDPYQIIERNVG